MKRCLSCWPPENPVKRKRGRPKGSTKKTRKDLTEGEADPTHSPEDTFQRQEERNKKEVDQHCNLIAGNPVATYERPVQDSTGTCNMPG